MRPQTTPRYSTLAALACIAALLLAACSSGTGSTSTSAPPVVASSAAASSPAAAAPGTVTIKGFAFGPASITVAAGTTVTWSNQDTTSHTVTADDGSFDSKAIGSGATFSQAFAKPGTYTYHCSIHSSMKATVVVN